MWLDIIAINQWPYVDEKGLLNDDVASLAKVREIAGEAESADRRGESSGMRRGC